jgi:hypothetical protein
MVIDQRNAGASVTNTTSTVYIVDRWNCSGTQASKFTVQQNAGSITPPVGFTNYLGVTSSSAYTVTSNDYFSVAQIIEGYNIADLGWGTANAKTVTVSFWVYSSLTGTFGGSLQTVSENYCYSFTYSIPVSNTWTQINVTISGPTSGTWNTNNLGGIYVWFGLGAAGTRVGTAGSWGTQSASGLQPSGTVSVVGTNGATFYITGVQLEAGSTATSFDYRPYGTELALCQRYFWNFLNSSGSNLYPVLQAYSANAVAGYFAALPVQMRATPTATFSGTLTPLNAAGAFTTALSNGSTTWGSSQNVVFIAGSGGSSGLVAGNACIVAMANGSFLQVTAEL